MARGHGRARRSAPARPGPEEARRAAFTAVEDHALFGPLLHLARPVDIDTWGVQVTALPRGGLLAADAHGGIVYNGRARAEAGRWMWSLCHVLTHLGLGHADPTHRDGRGSYAPEWRAACCMVVDRFLDALQIPGTPTHPLGYEADAEELAGRFATSGIPATVRAAGPAGGGPDLWEDLFGGRGARRQPLASPWGRAFAVGLTAIGGPASPPAQLCLPAGDPRGLPPAGDSL